MFESVKSLSFLTTDRVIYKEPLQRWGRMEMFVTCLKGNIKETTLMKHIFQRLLCENDTQTRLSNLPRLQVTLRRFLLVDREALF